MDRLSSCFAQLSQGLIEDDGNGVGKVQAAHPLAHHWNSVSSILMGVEELLRKAASLRTEDEEILCLKVGLRIGNFRPPGKEKELTTPVFLEKVLPGIVKADINILPVVESGPLEMLVVDFESQGGHEVERRVGGGAETGDTAGVGGYLRFH